MPDLASILERESRTVEAPDDFDHLVRRRDRRRRNRRIGAVIAAVALSSLAVLALVRAFGVGDRTTPADTPSPTALAGCPPGSTPNRPGPVDQDRPASNFYMPMAFDRGSGRIVLLRPRTGAPPTTWTFDVCTNTWQSMSPAQEPSGGRAWGPMAYDADSDLTVTVLDGGSVWAYDVESDTWTEKGPAPFDNVDYALSRMTYDPVSGLLWVRGAASYHEDQRMWTYDVDTDTWTEVPQQNTPALGPIDHVLFAYDTSVDRFVALAADRPTITFDRRTGRWSESQGLTPSFNTGFFASGGEVAYDEAAERTVVFSDDVVIAYDATADRWTRLYGEWRCCDEGPLARLGHRMVYDPLNERLVVYGGRARLPSAWTAMDDVWAFETATGEWIQLLPPS